MGNFELKSGAVNSDAQFYFSFWRLSKTVFLFPKYFIIIPNFDYFFYFLLITFSAETNWFLKFNFEHKSLSVSHRPSHETRFGWDGATRLPQGEIDDYCLIGVFGNSDSRRLVIDLLRVGSGRSVQWLTANLLNHLTKTASKQ